MFVTTLEMDNFDCTKMSAHFQKFIACLREGLINHEWKQALLAPPLPLHAKQLTALFHTQPLLSVLLYYTVMTTGILRILVKAQPSTRSIGPRSPTRLSIRSQDLSLPNEYSLGHCGFSAASTHKLAFTSRHCALLTATDTTTLHKIPCLCFFFLLSQSKIKFKVPTTT